MEHVINYMYIEHYISGAPCSKGNYKYIYICFGINIYIYIYSQHNFIYHTYMYNITYIYIIFIEPDTHIDGVLIYLE